jgi:nucleoside-diphosphate-sugar epimerase
MRLVAVTGASGYVGRFVVADLLRHGVAVRAWARAGTDRSGFPGPVEWVPGGLRDVAGMAAFVAGADAVVHAAYEHVPGRYRGGEGPDLAGYLAANLGGTLALLEAARAARVRRFVFLSSRAVYGRRLADRPLDEDHPAWPDTHYGAYKAAVEAFLASFAAAGLEACALRPTGVYGLVHPIRRSKWHDLVAAVLAGRPWANARGGTEVHGADVARAVRLLLTSPDVAGRAYNCSDLYVADRDVAEIVQAVAGVSGPLPDPPARLPTNVMDTGRLRALGLAFGGQALLERTVAELVAAVRVTSRGSGPPAPAQVPGSP